MRKKNLLAAALVLALVPGVAAAQEEACPPSSVGDQSSGMGGSGQAGAGSSVIGSVDEGGTCRCNCPPSDGQGGSGMPGEGSENELGAGGSGSAAGPSVIGSVDESGTCRCNCPSPSQGGTGGFDTGEQQQPSSPYGSQGMGAPSDQPEPGMGDQPGAGEQEGGVSPQAEGGVQAQPSAPEQNVTVIQPPEEGQREKDWAGKGLTIGVTPGVEGFFGALAPRVDAGLSWGAVISAQPTRTVGLEAQYIGANNRVTDPNQPSAEAAGTRLIRNGGNLLLKVALAPTAVTPFVFGGAGISRTSIRNEAPGTGYQDDTFGQVPLGGGLELHIGNFTAGARFTYNLLFDQEFAPTDNDGAIYNGQLLIGGTF